MTPLKETLIRQISVSGPISVADYMTACLFHPQHGYYTTTQPLGSDGDFVTAPDVSQMFGELVGLCLGQAWLDQGAPAPFALVELGPGRGTLMADILRAAGKIPGFADAAQVHLIEISPVLRAEQSKRLPTATWHDGLETVPDLPLFLIANEFFDALPIRQLIKDTKSDGWTERVIGVRAGELTFGLAPPVPPETFAVQWDALPDGAMLEHRATALPIAAEIGRRIDADGGAALVIDYGDWSLSGDTFQALRKHRKVPPLETPGLCDLTSHVSFEQIARDAAPAAAAKLCPQGVFLGRLGIEHRAERLAKALTGPSLDAHIAGFNRLTSTEEMGHLFKVLGLYPSSAPPPPGLDP